jgi:hypothetical protein
MSILNLAGLKRRLSSALLSLSGVVSQIPGAEVYGAILAEAAGILGGGGILHALIKGDVLKFKFATLVSTIASLIALSPTIPELAPYQPLLQSILVLLGLLGYRVKK